MNVAVHCNLIHSPAPERTETGWDLVTTCSKCGRELSRSDGDNRATSLETAELMCRRAELRDPIQLVLNAQATVKRTFGDTAAVVTTPLTPQGEGFLNECLHVSLNGRTVGHVYQYNTSVSTGT